jgi:hypothetical protein
MELFLKPIFFANINKKLDLRLQRMLIMQTRTLEGIHKAMKNAIVSSLLLLLLIIGVVVVLPDHIRAG